MAGSFGQSHTPGNSKTSGTNNASATLAANIPAGRTVVAWIVYDNLTASTPVVSSINVPAGETAAWVNRFSVNAPVATAAASCRGELWVIKTTVQWNSGQTITPVLSAAVAAKVVALADFLDVSTTVRGVAGTGSNATASSMTASSSGTAPQAGDVALLLFGNEDSVACGVDTDTLGGSWVDAFTATGTSGGAAATNTMVRGQYKILTAANAQTANPSSGASDGVVGVVILVQDPPSLQLAAGAMPLTAGAGKASLVMGLNLIAGALPLRVGAGQAALALNPPGGGYGLFTTQTPITPNANDGSTLTLGTVIEPLVAGQITHGRWYFPTVLPASATYVLYDFDTQTELARVAFSSPTAGAWNTVALPSPVTRTANQRVIACVVTPSNYVASNDFFTAASITNGNLRGPQTLTTSSGNGRFISGDAFPTSTFQGSAYFVDVLFVESGGGGSPLSLTAGASPILGGTNSAALRMDYAASSKAPPLMTAVSGSTLAMGHSTTAQTQPLWPLASRGGLAMNHSAAILAQSLELFPGRSALGMDHATLIGASPSWVLSGRAALVANWVSSIGLQPLPWSLGNAALAFPAAQPAPTGPFASGTEVGVPTGTTLTTRTSLGAATGSGVKHIQHPVSGAAADLSVSIWENIRFTSTFTVNPPAGQHYLFRNCEWNVNTTSWCVEVADTNGVSDQMQPLVVFERCSFQGNGDSNIAVAGSYIWLENCDIKGMLAPTPASGASDGWQGAAYSVAVNSNIIAGTNANDPDPHSDGMQNAGTGVTTLYYCWCSAGGSAGANAAVRFGSEFGAVTNVEVYYCGLDDGGYAMQMDGSKGGNAGVTNVKVRGCRWTRTAVYGPVDFVNVQVSLWENNTYFDGEVIPNPAPSSLALVAGGLPLLAMPGQAGLALSHATSIRSQSLVVASGRSALALDFATAAKTMPAGLVLPGAALLNLVTLPPLPLTAGAFPQALASGRAALRLDRSDVIQAQPLVVLSGRSSLAMGISTRAVAQAALLLAGRVDLQLAGPTVIQVWTGAQLVNATIQGVWRGGQLVSVVSIEVAP